MTEEPSIYNIAQAAQNTPTTPADVNIALTPEQAKIKELTEIIGFQEFFADPIKSNSTIQQGLKLVLNRLENVEKMLINIEKSIQELKNGNR